jgi:hypothetical protein
MYNLLNPTLILIPKIEACPCNFLGIILHESTMVIGACIYPVVGNCAAVFLINLPSELMSSGGLAKTQSLLPVKHHVESTDRYHRHHLCRVLLMSSSRSTLLGQRHLILSQNTEAFNVIELAIRLILLVEAFNFKPEHRSFQCNRVGNQADFIDCCFRFSFYGNKWLGLSKHLFF